MKYYLFSQLFSILGEGGKQGNWGWELFIKHNLIHLFNIINTVYSTHFLGSLGEGKRRGIVGIYFY